MKYTTSKQADEKIEQDLKIIKNLVLKEVKPIAIVFFGGFGHENGSFKKIKGKITPLNDYDLYLITKKKISNEILEELGKKCSAAIGRGGLEIVENFEQTYDENKFFHVDMHCIPYKNLQKLYPTQRTFDLKTSLVVYGDKDILKKIPDVKISKSDAIRLLFNKMDHFAIAEGNSEKIKSIYAIKGFIDLCSALLILQGKYSSKAQDREKAFQEIDVHKELKSLVSKATKAKLYGGYEIEKVNSFFEESKKWVEWTLKKALQRDLNERTEDWKALCKEAYKKLPYNYFDDYLGSRFLFPAQYYLNLRFFAEGLRKKEFLIKSLMHWRDAGIIIAISLILYSLNEKKEAEKYLKKLTGNTQPLKDRILKLYSIYYLQKLV
ncbi:Uncharacterised protein [uncultured archaeon]|nr:Uncharacterised protein [uncultured archaeon]